MRYYYLIYSPHKTLVSLERENRARLSEKPNLLSQQTRDTVSNWSTTRRIHNLTHSTSQTAVTVEKNQHDGVLDKISCQSLEKLKRVSAKTGLATSSRFHIPDLQVRKHSSSKTSGVSGGSPVLQFEA